MQSYSLAIQPLGLSRMALLACMGSLLGNLLKALCRCRLWPFCVSANSSRVTSSVMTPSSREWLRLVLVQLAGLAVQRSVCAPGRSEPISALSLTRQ